MPTSSGSLLIVDDNEMNRDMLCRRLQRLGYRVLAAADGPTALELVATRDIALVLLDIEMPGMSGLAVLDALRNLHAPGTLPIIMVTARQESEDVVQALRRGANDYVTKPVDLAIATARIETQLARKQAEDALRESEERYALAVRGANDGLWDWDLRTNRVYFSPRWVQMLGLPDSEILDSPNEWFNRVHPEDIDRLMAEIAAHVEDLIPQLENQHRVLHADGTYRWMLSRAVAVRDLDGKAYRMAGSQTDVTEGKVLDPLTGLPNRVLFMDRLGRAIERAHRRKDYLFAVLFLDLDRFKLVNDSLGHMLGDQLLIAFAERLAGCLRSADTVARIGADPTVARLGGGEFTILLEDLTSLSDAIRVAERIRDVFVPPFQLEQHEVFTSVSIGIASSASGYTKAEDLIRDADTAMYRAKALGKARCEVFDAQMRDQAVARLALEGELRRAIQRLEFELHYQPIVSLARGTIVGFEALIRWKHPQRGLISPAEFIPVAEETGLIVAIGSWVLQEACRQLGVWHTTVPTNPALTMHVNLSPKEFLQPDLAVRIDTVLGETGIPPSCLNVEITETTLVENLEAVVTTLDQMKHRGVHIAIDDFGTGYSSLNYLHRLPIDALKIDRSFVSSMATDRFQIVLAIIGLAHNLGLDVIAEGIECADHLSRLSTLGCEYGQGDLFSKPLDREGATALLAAARNGAVTSTSIVPALGL